MRKVVAVLGLVLALAVMVAACSCPPCPETPVPTPIPTDTPDPWVCQWDERLTLIGVGIEWDPEAKYWPVAAWMTIDGSWLPEDVPEWALPYLYAFPEAGGDHNVFGRVLDANGNVLYSQAFQLQWPDGVANRYPEPSGWANVPIFAHYFPDQGEMGPYTWRVVDGMDVTGIGLPYKRHISVFVVSEER